MNREIRFRAWDSYNKKMIELGDLESISMRKTAGHDDDFANFELMQYTGLKAKNGKIYEGDILQWHWVNDPKQIEKDVVTYERGSFMIGKGFLGNALVSGSFEYKVIGNIYENKELLI